MRNILLPCLLALVVVSGCIPSEPLAPGQINQYWRMAPNVWEQSQRKELTFGDKPFPSRWTFRQEPSLIWSTVSMVRATDALEAGANEFQMDVSPTHAEMMRLILADVRGTLDQLRDIADPRRAPKAPGKWAEAVAGALVSAEKVARLSTAQPGKGQCAEGEALGWTAGPVIQLMTRYLNDRTSGSLLSGMEDQTRLREVLTQVVLRLGFSAAGKQDPPGLRDRIAKMMEQADRPEELGDQLSTLLLNEFANAHPAEATNQLPGLMKAAFSVANNFLLVAEDFCRQWHKMDHVTFELREYEGKPVVSVDVVVAKGQELRLVTLMPFQPVFAFRGGTRITVLPKDLAEESVVLFDPLDGGRAELRFEGIVYGLARLFAFPLADASLREIRVASESDATGSLTSVTILMNALHGAGDPSRILVVQDARSSRVERTAFQVRKQPVRSEQVFNYLTPDRRYTYQRVKADTQ